MAKSLFVVIFLFFAATSFAQIDRSTGSNTGGGIKIPAAEIPAVTPDKSILSKDGLYNKPQTSFKFPEEKKPFSMTTDNGLMTHTLENFTPKAFTKDKEALEEYRRDQYLGDYLTTGNFVELYCRDHEYVDGDKVRVYVNGELVQASVSLGAGYTPILVKLNRGFNTIEFEALNQGTSGPNTAELRIFDDKGNPLAQKEWNLLTGSIARIVVVKN